MRPAAREAFGAEVARWEGRVPHMYLDHKGYVTCGVGNLVDPVSLALELPWVRSDGEVATEDEVRADWARVKALPPALVARRYRDETQLHLTDETIDDLVARRRDQFWQTLVGYLPTLESAPAPAQLGALLMAWALGPNFPMKWPRFSTACLTGYWAVAADECEIRGARPERNAHHRGLFLAAATGSDPDAL
jgi:hypothetical protein